MAKFSMTKQKFINQWLRHFAQGINKDQYEKYVKDQYVWHVFSWELIKPDGLLIGDAARQAYNEAVKIEKILEEKLDFAYDNNLGYLTECPSNLGTGIRASAMIHLPALESMNALEKVFNTARKTGIAIRGTFGEGSKAKSSMYQISNQVTLGVSEEELIENVKSVVKYLIEMEERNV